MVKLNDCLLSFLSIKQMVMLRVMIFDIFDSIGYKLYGCDVAVYEKQSI